VIVVADAGPLIHLSLLGRIDLLPTIYGRILVPDLVYKEVQAGEGMAGASEVKDASWIDVVQHEPEADLFRSLQAQLDPGEAAALWLGTERQADWILSDDRQARLAAERLGLQVRGTLGVLAEAKRRGLVPELSSLLRQLKAEGVWLSERLIQAVLLECGERR
jgi:uncharacterized protein